MDGGNLYGLFVGVNRYHSSDIRPLAFASADVIAVRDKLVERYGLEYRNTVVVADGVEGGVVPTRLEILRAINRFSAAPMKEADLFLFVFAGHGFSCNGRTFLAACDSEIASEALLRETAVSLDAVRDFLGQIPAGQQVLLLDACRDAPLRGARSVGSATMSGDMTRDIGAVIRPRCESGQARHHASAVLCSCWQGQVAHEYVAGGHGWFCHNLLAELDTADRHQLSLSELHQRIKARMQESAWRLLPAAKDQTPHLLIEGDIPVLRRAGQLAPVPTKAANTKPPQEVVLSCDLCGNSAAGDPFRCTHCGQVCCSDCTDPGENMCTRCAQKLAVKGEARAQTPKPSTVMHSAVMEAFQSFGLCFPWLLLLLYATSVGLSLLSWATSTGPFRFGTVSVVLTISIVGLLSWIAIRAKALPSSPVNKKAQGQETFLVDAPTDADATMGSTTATRPQPEPSSGDS